MAVRGGNGDDIHAAFDEAADMLKNSFFVQLAERIARGRDRRAADEMEIRIARRLELRRAFQRDALHVAQRDQPAQFVLVVHHEQLVDAEMLGEKLVGARNRVLAQFLLHDGVDLRARRERLRNLQLRVTRLDDVAGQQPDQLSYFVNHREGSEREFLLLNDGQHVADELFRRNLDRFLDQTVDVVLHAADLGDLLPLRHVVMDEAQAAVERHRDGHARFRHRVHVRRDGGDVQMQIIREPRVQLRVAREDFGIERRERDVVERQADLVVCGEKLVRRLIERIVEAGIARCCHVGKCLRKGVFGKKNFAAQA